MPEYEVAPGHTILVNTRSDSINAEGKLLRPGQRIPEGLLSKKEIAYKLRTGRIKQVGGVAVDPVLERVLAPHTVDLTKGDAPVKVTTVAANKTPETRVYPPVTTVKSPWVLDPEILEKKTLEQLLAMISERTKDEEEMKEAAKFTKEEAIAWLSQDWAATPSPLRQNAQD